MPTCTKCKAIFPNDIYVDGKRKTLHKRKYCLDCSAAGDASNSLHLSHGTKPIEINKVYGYLTTLEEVASPYPNAKRDTRRYYLCRCQCGKELIRPAGVIRKTKNGCGCFETNQRVVREKTIKCTRCQVVKDLSEYTVAIHKTTYKDGSTREVPHHKKQCKSCIVALGQERVNSKVEYKYLAIKSGCITRKISLEMSLEEFKQYWDLPCHYCGGERKTHGLDRKDSSGPYSVENCVACCSDCNYMKNTMSYEKFINKLRNIASNLLAD